jgi:multidrug resistance efflux pump
MLMPIAGCSERGAARGGESARPSERPAAQVEVLTVRPQTRTRRIPIVGTLFAAEEAVISTKASGILRRTFVDVAGMVAPGAPLTQVDTQDYEVAVKQAEASLAEVLARLGVKEVPDDSFELKQVSTVQRAAARVENTRFTYERLSQVGTYSGQEVNDAATELRVAEAEYQSAIDEAAALLASAQERQSLLQMAQQKLADTVTKTPPIPTTRGPTGAEEWVVAARFVTEGQYVNVGDPLYRLMLTHPLKLRSKVPERYAGEVRSDQRIELESMEGVASPQGRIARLSPAVEPASRTFEIEALIDNQSNALRPGAFAKGFIVAESGNRTVDVPVEAVMKSGEEARVFVVEQGVARRRSVQVGPQADGMVEIVAGLRDGERVVTRGAATLSDGMAVQEAAGS